MQNLEQALKSKIAQLDIPVIDSHQPVTDPHAFMAFVCDLKNLEGVVIAWEDGHRVKVKAEEYLRIHKTKDNLTHEKNVIDLLVNEKMDDVKSFMLDEDRKRVDEFEAVFWDGFARQVESYDKYFGMVLASKLDRKEYALKWMPTIKDQDPFAPQIVFGKFDGKDTWAMMLDIVRKNTGTKTKIEAVRHLWGGAQWNYHFDGDV